jgi:hypothetical protein
VDEPHYPTPQDPALASRLSGLDANKLEFFEERAAIHEFDAGLPRPQAEWAAWKDLLTHLGSEAQWNSKPG